MSSAISCLYDRRKSRSFRARTNQVLLSGAANDRVVTRHVEHVASRPSLSLGVELPRLIVDGPRATISSRPKLEREYDRVLLSTRY